ncbi:formylglycine-generating enzyme family protein [Cohnella fermenti]|uniref:Formylglycine-generating enzyme family protein n=1 Tax=Cohnella fermenti TaxID=2565925 RepID=A0A4S4BLN8_9BACL|nr:formylglycine-generating enzyme family protein [Cohnella fermenti]THF75699.1 formylglycine-generating enzyme family protein [Cohnella fermenti]
MENEHSSCCSTGRAAVGGDGPTDDTSVTFSSRLRRTPVEETPDTSGMVYIPEGSFLMGTNDREGFPADGEGPVHPVQMSGFYMDRYAVTNDEFARFVRATGYATEAERFGWSFVFHLFVSPATAALVTKTPAGTPWWLVVDGAYWAHPEGPDSNLDGRGDHPVVHVSWNDAMAYCRWSGKRLPTEAEWEYAARGGLQQKRYPWGDELKPGGEHRCNIWQGKFPIKDHASDGYSGTAPVDSYKPNGYGLYNMAGNVWEWCGDWFHPAAYANSEKANPQGPGQGTERVMRGGSYLCHSSYCNRYRVAARNKNTPDSSSGNIGFRCVVSATP